MVLPKCSRSRRGTTPSPELTWHWARGKVRLALGSLLTLLFFCALGSAQQNLIVEVVIHGNRRIPADTVRARIFSKPGDVYDESAMERDFNSLWNTGYYEDIRFEREQTPKGWRIHVYVKERPNIREITYTGLSSVTTSDILDRFKERKVGLTPESQYDPTKVKKAEVILKELLAEHGRQYATVRTEVHPLPPAAVSVTFVVREGPKVKVGKITFEGNKHVNSRTLRAAMKNLKPIGVPHSIFLESLFAKTYDATKLEDDTERVRGEFQNRGYFKVLVSEPKTEIRDTGHLGFHVPLLQHGPGKAVDITIPIEEGTNTGWEASPSRTTSRCPTQRRCARCSPSRTERSSAARRSPRAWRTCAVRMVSRASSTLRPSPIPTSMRTRSWSYWKLT